MKQKEKAKETTKTVHIPTTDEAWVAYKILCISKGRSVSQDLAEYVSREAMREGVGKMRLK